MTRAVIRSLIALGILAVGLFVITVVLILRQPAPTAPVLPSPNGYDDFVKAGQMLSGDVSGYRDLTEAQLRSLVMTNAGALNLMRTGLCHDCRVVLAYSVTNTSFLSDLAALKRLAQALAAEGRLAELDSRPGDAARCYSDMIRLGCETSRGGRVIESLVGIAIESIGDSQLQKLISMLDAIQCRTAATALETADLRRDSPAAILQQERDWCRRAYGLKGQFTRLLTFRLTRQTEQRLVSKFDAQRTQTRRLLVTLAVRAYQLEHGVPPDNLSALVPLYLKALPQNPLTGTNLSYP
jgi:hypothetical protein